MIRGQRVRRVVRSIDTWSVLRVAVLFHLSLMLVIVLAGVMLWIAGSVFGAVDGMESFMRGIGFDGFEFVGSQLLRGFTAVGLILVVLGTGATVLAALLYNLISDVVGGVQLTVLEEVYVPDEERLPVTVGESEDWAVAAAASVEAVETTAGDSAVAPVVPTEPAVAPEPEPAAEPEPVSAAEPEPEPASVSESEPTAEPEPVVAAEPEPVSAAEPEPAEPPRANGNGNGNGWTTPAWQPATRSQLRDQAER